MNAENEINQQVLDFASSVIAQREAAKNHDVTSGNNFALKYAKAAKKLLSSSAGTDAFSTLLMDSRVAVRTMAAAFLIPFRTNESKAVLEQSAKLSGVVALGANMALARWNMTGKGIDLD